MRHYSRVGLIDGVDAYTLRLQRFSLIDQFNWHRVYIGMLYIVYMHTSDEMYRTSECLAYSNFSQPCMLPLIASLCVRLNLIRARAFELLQAIRASAYKVVRCAL